MALGKYYADDEKGDKSQQLHGLQSRDIVYELEPGQSSGVFGQNGLKPSIIAPQLIQRPKIRFA